MLQLSRPSREPAKLGQADLRLSIEGFQNKTYENILIVRGLGICINTHDKWGYLPISFPFPQEYTEEEPSPSPNENKASKAVPSTERLNDTAPIFSVGNSNQDD